MGVRKLLELTVVVAEQSQCGQRYACVTPMEQEVRESEQRQPGHWLQDA